MTTTEGGFNKSRKLCFVTIGATANFDSLVDACLTLDFLQALQNARYTHLLVQYGKEYREKFIARKAEIWRSCGSMIDISGYDFKSSGILSDMRAAKGHYGGVEGAVISHAGSGSILEALRIDVPLVVVPNNTLLHNHQVEVAEILEEYGYVIYGRQDNLGEALCQVEQMRQKRKIGPPVNSGFLD